MYDKTAWLSCGSSHTYGLMLFPVGSPWSASYLFLFFVCRLSVCVWLIYLCSQLTICTAPDFWTPRGNVGMHSLCYLFWNTTDFYFLTMLLWVCSALIHLLSLHAGYDSFTCYLCPLKLWTISHHTMIYSPAVFRAVYDFNGVASLNLNA